MSPNYSWYGNGNIYNAAQMYKHYKDYVTSGNYPGKDSYWWRMKQFTTLNYDDISRMMYAYSWLVTEFALGGLTKSYSIVDLVKGYNSTTT